MSIPEKDVLLEAALKYLEQELLPALQGEHRFKTRLAINALRIVQRESAATRGMASDCVRAGHEDANASAAAGVVLPAGCANEAELARRIRAGEISIDDPQLRASLRQSLRHALSINNPKWLTR